MIFLGGVGFDGHRFTSIKDDARFLPEKPTPVFISMFSIRIYRLRPARGIHERVAYGAIPMKADNRLPEYLNSNIPPSGSRVKAF